MQRIVIVGSGHLAHALWEGWHRNPREPRNISLLARSDAHRRLWEPSVWDEVRYDPGIVRSADWVVLTVKPKDTEATLGKIKPFLAGKVLISPVAGWSIAQFRSLGVRGPIARIMPNVCAAIGASTTLAAFDQMPTMLERQVEDFIAECGPVTRIEEALINPYTALVGSGPAYIFLLLQALIDGGSQLGADASLTRELVSSMVEGAARLARDRSQDSLTDWIGRVASPGGTTEALLQVLKQAGWPGMIQDAVEAASRRAEELGVQR